MTQTSLQTMALFKYEITMEIEHRVAVRFKMHTSKQCLLQYIFSAIAVRPEAYIRMTVVNSVAATGTMADPCSVSIPPLELFKGDCLGSC